jgi:hypothetical protein
MNGAISCLVDNCYFGVCQTAIHGVGWGQTGAGYSNAHTFTNNEFAYCRYAFGNAGQTWCIGPGNTFEGSLGQGYFWHIYHDDYPSLRSNTLNFIPRDPLNPNSVDMITRTTGSFIDEGWLAVPGPVIVANSSNNNDGPIGHVKDVRDTYIVVSGPIKNKEASKTATVQYSNTAPGRYGVYLPPAQARNLVFTPTGPTQTPDGKHTGTIQRTDTASGGSFVVDGWQAGNRFEVIEVDRLHNVIGPNNAAVGTVTAVSKSTLTVSIDAGPPDSQRHPTQGMRFTPETSDIALVALPEVGTGNLTFISNWTGDQYVTLPWMWFHGVANNINIIGGNSFQSSGRVAIFDGGGGWINISGNKILAEREPIAVNYNAISGMTILNNITENRPTGNSASPLIGGITGGGLVNQYLIQGNFNTNNPDYLATDAIDISGYIALHKYSLTLSNGLNLDVPLGGYSYVEISGPTEPFQISGFTGGLDGYVLELVNLTSQAMTLNHEDDKKESIAANRIHSVTGASVSLPARKSYAKFIYSHSRWMLVSST